MKLYKDKQRVEWIYSLPKYSQFIENVFFCFCFSFQRGFPFLCLRLKSACFPRKKRACSNGPLPFWYRFSMVAACSAAPSAFPGGVRLHCPPRADKKTTPRTVFLQWDLTTKIIYLTESVRQVIDSNLCCDTRRLLLKPRRGKGGGRGRGEGEGERERRGWLRHPFPLPEVTSNRIWEPTCALTFWCSTWCCARGGHRWNFLFIIIMGLKLSFAR